MVINEEIPDGHVSIPLEQNKDGNLIVQKFQRHRGAVGTHAVSTSGWRIEIVDICKNNMNDYRLCLVQCEERCYVVVQLPTMPYTFFHSNKNAHGRAVYVGTDHSREAQRAAIQRDINRRYTFKLLTFPEALTHVVFHPTSQQGKLNPAFSASEETVEINRVPTLVYKFDVVWNIAVAAYEQIELADDAADDGNEAAMDAALMGMSLGP